MHTKALPNTCFPCEDNKITCETCKNAAACNGCKVCKTPPKTPCIHCDIDCVYERACGIRSGWIYDIELEHRRSKIPTEWMNCKECAYDYTCAYTPDGGCPEENDIMQSPLTETKDITNSTKDTIQINNTQKTKPTKQKKATNNFNKQIYWNTGLSCIEECPHTKGATLRITMDVYYKITYLQEMFPDVEFTVYGNARPNDTGTYILDNIIIPKQKAGHASVDDIECDGEYNTIIHKHPGDTPGGFSHDDKEFANSNHDFSILIGSKDLSAVIGVARIKTECNKFMRVKLDVGVVMPAIGDTFFLESTKNIEKKTYTTPVYYANQDFWRFR